MASPKRIKETLQARQLRLAEIDKEVERVLSERNLIPIGQNSTGQARPVGIQPSSNR